jgi:hypothetical protein
MNFRPLQPMIVYLIPVKLAALSFKHLGYTTIVATRLMKPETETGSDLLRSGLFIYFSWSFQLNRTKTNSHRHITLTIPLK